MADSGVRFPSTPPTAQPRDAAARLEGSSAFVVVFLSRLDVEVGGLCQPGVFCQLAARAKQPRPVGLLFGFTVDRSLNDPTELPVALLFKTCQ